MVIKYAILGLLSWRPFSGYDLKKIFVDQTFMYWSGNNNQIYRTLVQLLQEGLVTNEVQKQEHLPDKKIYSITEKGLSELKEWLFTSPAVPEFRNTFLIQLAWANQLEPDELDSLLTKYEYEVEMQVQMEKEKARRGIQSPKRNQREAYLWEMITENVISTYENELNWVRKLRRGLGQQGSYLEGELTMKCQVVKKNGIAYVEGLRDKRLIENVNDALDVVAYCGENDTNRLMLHVGNLSDDFFNLKTGLAGEVLQKFVNYQIKAVAVIPAETVNQGRFREMALEANKGPHFHIFSNPEDAEEWLIR